jgi:aromatic-L-amino-acid decarboxylase
MFCQKPEVGYIKSLVPAEAPVNPQSWQDIMDDFKSVIMPGVTHWHSPKLQTNSYPGIVTDILSGAIACIGYIGFAWKASPACTELEVVLLDWLGKMLKIREESFVYSNGEGGDVIQGTV